MGFATDASPIADGGGGGVGFFAYSIPGGGGQATKVKQVPLGAGNGARDIRGFDGSGAVGNEVVDNGGIEAVVLSYTPKGQGIFGSPIPHPTDQSGSNASTVVGRIGGAGNPERANGEFDGGSGRNISDGSFSGRGTSSYSNPFGAAITKAGALNGGMGSAFKAANNGIVSTNGVVYKNVEQVLDYTVDPRGLYEVATGGAQGGAVVVKTEDDLAITAATVLGIVVDGAGPTGNRASEFGTGNKSFVLNPTAVPEPASISFLITGLAAFIHEVALVNGQG